MPPSIRLRALLSPYQGILPYSGGLLSSNTCIHPPLPADPAPPWPLAPPLESAEARRLRAFWPVSRTPPELRLAPEVDIITWAWEILSGSSCAWLEITSCKMFKKPGFSLKDCGVGGSWDVIPMARSGFVGFVGRKERIWPLAPSFGNTYYLQTGMWVKNPQALSSSSHNLLYMGGLPVWTVNEPGLL